MPAYNKKVRVPGKSAQELYEKISKDIEHMVSKWGLPNAKLSHDAANKKVQLKAPMVEATLSCHDGELRHELHYQHGKRVFEGGAPPPTPRTTSRPPAGGATAGR